MASPWRITAVDLKTKTPRCELPLTEWQFTAGLHQPGMWEATLSMDDERATTDYLQATKTLVVFEREGQIPYVGILWDADPDPDRRTLRLSGAEVMSYFYRRRIRTNLAYALKSRTYIARALITWAQTQLGGNIGVVVGSENTGEVVSRDYRWYDRVNIGEEIQRLGGAEDGFDAAIEASWVAGDLVLTLVLYNPWRGYDRGVVLEYGSNVTTYKAPSQGSTMVTLADVAGSGDQAAMLMKSAIATPMLYSDYPLLETVENFREESDLRALQQKANQRLAAGKIEVPATQLTLVEGVGNFPTLNEIGLGDYVRVRIDDTYTVVDATHKVTSLTVAPQADQESDVLVVSTVDADAFVGA